MSVAPTIHNCTYLFIASLHDIRTPILRHHDLFSTLQPYRHTYIIIISPLIISPIFFHVYGEILHIRHIQVEHPQIGNYLVLHLLTNLPIFILIRNVYIFVRL